MGAPDIFVGRRCSSSDQIAGVYWFRALLHGFVARLDTRPDPSFGRVLSGDDRLGNGPPELRHPVEHIDPDHRLSPLGLEPLGAEPVADDPFVPKHRVLSTGLLMGPGFLSPLSSSDVGDPFDGGVSLLKDASIGSRLGSRGGRGLPGRNNDPNVGRARPEHRAVSTPRVIRTVPREPSDGDREPANHRGSDPRVVLVAPRERGGEYEPVTVDAQVELPPASAVAERQLEIDMDDN